MKTDIQTIRELFEKLSIPYTTIVKDGIIYLSIYESPSITFLFSQETGDAHNIYNVW